jgi:hypothetical protein
MQFLILFLILAATTFEYLAKRLGAPGVLNYTPEIMAVFVSAYVVVAGARTRFQNVRFEYWVVFGAILVVVLSGIAMNGVGAGPVFAGMRTYLRAIPMFFLPAVMALDDKKLKRQLMLILLLSLVQGPLTVYQRTHSQAEGHITGDLTIGTLMNTNYLTVFLVCVACVLAGMYLRKRISLLKFIVLVLLVLVPTTVNETKGTVVLAPVGLLTTFIVGARPGKRVSNALIALLVISVFGSIFLPVYDYYSRQRWGYGLVDFFTMQGRVEGYLEKRHAAIGAPTAGRVDAIVIPLEELAHDPPELAFGLGVGNASDSALGTQFTGHYFRRFEPFRLSTGALLIMETGLLGLTLVYVLYWLIFRDVRWVATHHQGLTGALAVGWMGVVAVITIATFYTNVMSSNALSFLFWYFSGYVAAKHAAPVRHAARAASAPQLMKIPPSARPGPPLPTR